MIVTKQVLKTCISTPHENYSVHNKEIMIIDYLTISPGSTVTRYGITVGKKKSKDYKLVNKNDICESVLFKLVLVSN